MKISKKLEVKCPHLASLSPQINSQWIQRNTDSYEITSHYTHFHQEHLG